MELNLRLGCIEGKREIHRQIVRSKPLQPSLPGRLASLGVPWEISKGIQLQMGPSTRPAPPESPNWYCRLQSNLLLYPYSRQICMDCLYWPSHRRSRSAREEEGVTNTMMFGLCLGRIGLSGWLEGRKRSRTAFSHLCSRTNLCDCVEPSLQRCLFLTSSCFGFAENHLCLMK